MSITFNGHHLLMSVRGKSYVYPAISGEPDSSGRFGYSKEQQQRKALGPIPAGQYWIDPDQLWHRGWYQFSAASGWGNYRITLHVMPGTQANGRGGFFIHGGDVPGSAGCIDLTSQMDAFVATLLKLVADERDCYVPVHVVY